MTVRRFLERLPPKVVIGILAAPLIVAIVAIGVAIPWFLHGSAPGAEDRFLFVVACLFLLQRLSKNSGLRPGTAKRTIDVCVSLALGFCVLWYIRTASTAPFDLSAMVWYVAAWMIGWGLAWLIDRFRKPIATAAD
jgi:hypothetical protein